MRLTTFAAISSLLLVPLAALADDPKKPDPKPADPAAELAPGTAALAPIRAGSLTLIPLVATAPPAKDDPLIVLDDAMREKLVRIHEVDAGGNVNELTLTNKAKQPVFLLAGEVIIGGKQDRIIGRNTIIPASTTQQVPVFCVEHGRWSTGESTEFTTANALAHGRLRAKASFEDQGEVWSEVASKNAVRQTDNDTDTYRKVATQQVDGTLAADEKSIRAALAKLAKADRARMVGYAVAINGDVVSVDVFGSPALFKKLEGKLMRSYLTEAVDIAAVAKAKVPTVKDVKAFMADADAAAEQDSYATDAASTRIQGGTYAAKASVKMKREGKPRPGKQGDPAPPAAATEDAAPVFQNYSSTK